MSDRPIITAEEILSTPYPEMLFLFGPNLLPRGGRMLLTAENGTGKSAMALYLSACSLTGTPLFGFKNTHKGPDFGKPLFPVIRTDKILYIDYEVPHAIRKSLRLKPLVDQFGREFTKNLIFATFPTDFRLEGEGFIKLIKLVKEVGPDMMIIDPLSSSHSEEENSSRMRVPLNHVDRLIDASGAASMVLHHASTKKPRTSTGEVIPRSGKEQSRGHSSITDWADFNLLITDKTSGQNKIKTLELCFAKTRYSHQRQRRHISADIGNMIFEPTKLSPTSKLLNELGEE